MTEFEIGITLVMEAEKVDVDSIPNYGNRYIDCYHDGDKWDITLTNTVEAETVQEAVATLSDDLRKSFSEVDPNWHGLVLQDDDEVVELMALDAGGDTYFHPRPVNEHGQELAGKLSKENLDHQKSHWDRKTGDWTNG